MPKSRRWGAAVAVALLAACHSEAFTVTPTLLGPASTGPDVQLTYNAEQDYWPAWTADGKGILYSFVPLDATPAHRCIGLLPAAGGTRLWQLCDNRYVQHDSITSYTGYALNETGRLLYAEASVPVAIHDGAPTTTLWLADTAAPVVRTPILRLPATVGGMTVTWLSDIAWTGPTSFIALAQQWNTSASCPPPPATPCQIFELEFHDTVFASRGLVVTGSVSGGQASLTPIVGTDSATGYSLVDDGATVVFTRRDDVRLLKVPRAGGAVTEVARVTPGDANELLGVTCRLSTCLVSRAPVVLTFGGDSDPFGRGSTWAHVVGVPWAVTSFQGELRSVSLTTGAVSVVYAADEVVATPLFSPVSSNVVAQVGGIWGHLQTFERGGRNSSLHLLTGLGVP